MRVVVVILLAALLSAPVVAFPQQAVKSQKKRPPAAAKQPATNLRADVAAQLKLLTRFLYLYGRISNGLETAEEQARQGKIPETVLAKTRQNKADVVANIAGIRTSLEKLGQAFHADPKLQRLYLKLLAASDGAANAEQLAKAGRFDEAGRALVVVAERLTDVISQM